LQTSGYKSPRELKSEESRSPGKYEVNSNYIPVQAGSQVIDNDLPILSPSEMFHHESDSFTAVEKVEEGPPLSFNYRRKNRLPPQPLESSFYYQTQDRGKHCTS
jgi:hypothetical protein